MTGDELAAAKAANTIDLDAIERRCKAATEGPWRCDDESWIEVNDITVYSGKGETLECVCNMGWPIANVENADEAKISYANGQFVAHARTDLPALVTLAREQQSALSAREAEIERLRGALQKIATLDYTRSALNGAAYDAVKTATAALAPAPTAAHGEAGTLAIDAAARRVAEAALKLNASESVSGAERVLDEYRDAIDAFRAAKNGGGE